MHITNQDGGDRVLARWRELVDSATQMMVTDEFYDGKPWADFSEEEELMQWLPNFAGIHMQQTGKEDLCGQIFRVMKMDTSVPVDSMVFIQKRALRKYLVDGGLTVVKPSGRQHTLKHGNVLVEATAAGIELLEFRCKVEQNTCYDLVTYDPDALFDIIAAQLRDKLLLRPRF